MARHITAKQLITPFLWFDHQAEDAVKFYTTTFANSKVKLVTRYGKDVAKASGRKEGTVMTVSFQVEGQDFIALNGGPGPALSPAISFFVHCDKPKDVDRLWAKLSPGGEVITALDKYPFSDRYGWIKDRFGVSWQLIVARRKQRIAPCLMFAGKQHLKSEDAIRFYMSVFKNSKILLLERYRAGQGPDGAVVHSKFALNGQEFTAMDSQTNMPLDFTQAISLVVNCATQKDIDYYWSALSEGGDEKAQVCGWLQDKYGVSWQIVPKVFFKMLSDRDPKKSDRVMTALLQMKKIDIALLKKAYEQRS
jgi:predicted 3-demethylubiquinone-9 3-methyltransferase (glyoxalase superfamily)